jgi:hypothetical protein
VHLETINAVAQLPAAIGVIASLFYLAAQIKQNTHSRGRPAESFSVPSEPSLRSDSKSYLESSDGAWPKLHNGARL